MTLYIVHGNTYYNGYGHVENIFGVYTNKETAEKAKDMVIKDLYKEEMENTYTEVEDISDIGVDILEIEADKYINVELGGYCE